MSDHSPTLGITEEDEVTRCDYFLSKMVSRGYTLSSSDVSYLIGLLLRAWVAKRKKSI
jgi:hypothetical protein